MDANHAFNIFLVTLIILLYGSSLQGGFIWDDRAAIVSERYLESTYFLILINIVTDIGQEQRCKWFRKSCRYHISWLLGPGYHSSGLAQELSTTNNFDIPLRSQPLRPKGIWIPSQQSADIYAKYLCNEVSLFAVLVIGRCASVPYL